MNTLLHTSSSSWNHSARCIKSEAQCHIIKSKSQCVSFIICLRDHRTGYDGKKVDVWAAGVLLFVMLAGVFPFETQDDNFNNTAGLYDIWLQQIKTSWCVFLGASGVCRAPCSCPGLLD